MRGSMGRLRTFNHAKELVMKSIVTALVVALAFALATASAFAADAQKPADAAKKPAAAAATKQAKPVAMAAAADKGSEVRDWAKIDTNKDNLISPEEMEAYLKANPGPLRTTK
jgi:hypothetical protein